MTRPIPIEIDGQAVGIAEELNGRYRFVAVKFGVWDLDGAMFNSLAAVQNAAEGVLHGAPYRAIQPQPEVHLACL
ncbi:hypothetical protein HDIA_4398 [Hartmannibacter diazotrophicus]|uniref:Uncharacterized protein n=2 Tax=Hartmannibacter diazotrophicus TaxID=1482074 RepID=A0A2C9DCN4_9HYPH|nr:hypothetical protein HDIA_4398 [Hartmannibacter diazotrophicus]